VQDNAADELNVKRAQVNRPLGRFTHGRKGARQNLPQRGLFGFIQFSVQVFEFDLERAAALCVRLGGDHPALIGHALPGGIGTGGHLCPQLGGQFAQGHVTYRLKSVFQAVDLVYNRLEPGHLALGGITHHPAQKILEHTMTSQSCGYYSTSFEGNLQCRKDAK